MGKNFIEQGNRHYQDPKITNNNITLWFIQRNFVIFATIQNNVI